jgi:chromosomal replication initiator protein
MIRVSDIQQAVAQEYSLPVAWLSLPDGIGVRTYARPRQVAMYLCRRLRQTKAHAGSKLGPMSYPEIGRKFGRDHTTVIHACRQIERMILVDANTASKVAALVNNLSPNTDPSPTSLNIVSATAEAA